MTLALLPFVALLALGLEAGHSVGHLFEPDHGGEYFAADHAQPISERHVEAARAVPEGECVACALRSSSSESLRTGHVGPGAPPEGRGASHQLSPGFEQQTFSPLLGRAPPRA